MSTFTANRADDDPSVRDTKDRNHTLLAGRVSGSLVDLH